MTQGAGVLKKGENGKGISSRWYPKTLANRIHAINKISRRITFLHEDGFQVICRDNSRNIESLLFVDPPYDNVAKRLYDHHELDHERLFALMSAINSPYLMTYNSTDFIKELVSKYCLDNIEIKMKSSHNIYKTELLISKDLNWLK